MAHKIKDKTLTGSTYRPFVIETIKQLYPEESFPKNLFPDLKPLLLEFFLKEINSRKEQRELVRGDSGRKAAQDLAKKTLGFMNLLKNHPRMVVLIYRRYIEKFIYYKHRKIDEREDILQEVITRLIEDKIYKVSDRYDFNLKKISTFTSYLMVTIRNIYIDIVRERKIRPLTAGELQPVDELFNPADSENVMNRMLIEEELVKFQTVMKLYYKARPKLELCLKLKFRIPIGKKETSQCFPGCSREDIKMLTQDFKLVKDKTMFERVVLIFNRYGDKKSKSDTIRKWIFVKIDEIISHLNRTHNGVVYNRKNVGDLVSLYYQYEGEVSQFPVSSSKLFLRG